MVVTEKRHMYETGTVNVETGNVAVKQDINYYSANVQSATRSIIRMIEDMDRRFSQNQIYDGATVSDGTTTVDVASGTLKIGGRWVSLSGTNISAGLSDDTYFVVAQVTGITENNTRDPSGGEAVTLTLVSSGSYTATDFKLVLGSAVIASSGVTSVTDRAKRQINATIIKPYGGATQVSILTGDSPVYREAIRFTSDSILPYNKIVSEFSISGSIISGSGMFVTDISGSTLDITGVSNLQNVYLSGILQVSGTSSEVVDLSGSSISAIDFAIGSKVLSQSEFDNLDGIDQPLDTTQSPSFVQLLATQTGSVTPPFVVSSTGKVIDLDSDTLDGQHAPTGVIVGTTDAQTLTNKTLTDPIIGSFKSGTHDHTDVDGGAQITDAAFSSAVTVSKGGTGRTTLTDGGILLGDGATAIEQTARPTSGQILVGQGSGSPTLQTSTITLSGELGGNISMGVGGDFALNATVEPPTKTIRYQLDLSDAILTGATYGSSGFINIGVGDSIRWIFCVDNDMFFGYVGYNTYTVETINFYCTGASMDIATRYVRLASDFGQQTVTGVGGSTRTHNITDRILDEPSFFEIIVDGISASSCNIWNVYVEIELKT